MGGDLLLQVLTHGGLVYHVVPSDRMWLFVLEIVCKISWRSGVKMRTLVCKVPGAPPEQEPRKPGHGVRVPRPPVSGSARGALRGLPPVLCSGPVAAGVAVGICTPTLGSQLHLGEGFLPDTCLEVALGLVFCLLHPHRHQSLVPGDKLIP